MDEVKGRSVNQDLRLELRIRNNILYRAIFAQYDSVAELCEVAKRRGISLCPVVVGQLLNFTIHPISKKTGKYRTACLALEEILQIPVEDLFPLALYAKISGGQKVLEVNSAVMLSSEIRNEWFVLPAPEEKTPETIAGSHELHERITALLHCLPARQRTAVEMRFGLGVYSGQDHTLEEIGKKLGVTYQRARQILERALRELQRPTATKQLKAFVEPVK